VSLAALSSLDDEHALKTNAATRNGINLITFFISSLSQ